METKVVVTKRFRNKILKTYTYILNEFDSRTAFLFLEKLEKKVELIISNSMIGQQSKKRTNVRSFLFLPHQRIYYRLAQDRIELLTLFDTRNQENKMY